MIDNSPPSDSKAQHCKHCTATVHRIASRYGGPQSALHSLTTAAIKSVGGHMIMVYTARDGICAN